MIPALNVAATLPAQLDALSAQACDCKFEVIVADNGSTDDTAAIVEAHSTKDPRFKKIDATAFPGINYARNVGASAARGSFILFCDGDDIVDTDWIAAMRDVLLRYDAVAGAVEHRRLNGESQRSVHLQSKLLRPSFLPSPLGANCGVRAAVWRDLGGFDEEYLGGAADDIEFFWRLQLRGYTLGMTMDAVVYYRLPGSLKAKSRKAYRAGHEGVRLHKQFRSAGHPKRSLLTAIRSVLSLCLRAPIALVSKSQREKWQPMAANQLGRFVGSKRYRTLYL